MDKKILKRNKYIVWYRNSSDNSIITSVRDKHNFVRLRGLQSWLWSRLSSPCSVDKIKELMRKKKEYVNCRNKLNRAIKPLIGKKILQYTQKDATRRNIPKRYVNLYARVFREVNAAKNFVNSQDLNIYHKNSISTSEQHFETKEVTVSHIYRYPHVALSGLSYGAKLYRKLNSNESSKRLSQY